MERRESFIDLQSFMQKFIESLQELVKVSEKGKGRGETLLPG